MNVFQPRDGHLYFVYGTNMDPTQMAARCSKPEAVAVARLADHRLAFFGYSPVWNGGDETAIYHPGEDLWGVLYRLSFSDADVLDTWQGARIDGCGAYFHCPAEVVDGKGVRHKAIMYKKDDCKTSNQPSEECLDLIIAAAAAQGLPENYLERLKRMGTKKAGYPVPRKDLSDRGFLFNRPCTGCG